MKLILSLALIWMLSSTAEALKCLHNDRNDTSVLLSCLSADEMCATIITTHEGQFGSAEIVKRIDRSCVSSFLCAKNSQTLSVSTSDRRLAASVHCCNTSGCNNQYLPYPDVQVKNDLQCVSCAMPSCTERVNVQCVGVQDRCFKANVTHDDDTSIFFGCASANLCELFSQLDVQSASSLIGRPVSAISSKCCKSSFCNSAWTVKLSVAPLLLGLVALIVY